MKGLDARNWGLWEWTEAACLLVGAVALAVLTWQKESPELPRFLRSTYWGYVPLLLLVAAVGIHVVRVGFMGAGAAPKADETHPLSPRWSQSEPPAEFKLLPIHYKVDFTQTLPDVEVGLYAVHFLSQPLTLTKVTLSLRLFGHALEDITFRNEDLEVYPKEARVVFCRRHLTDAERTALPWRAGRETGSFDLSAKATHGGQTYSYKTNAHVIEGWVNVPPRRTA